MKARRFLFLGAPGVGKGTQAQRLARELGIPQIATGEMLRATVAAGSEIGKQAQSYMDRGELVPDDVVIGVAESRLSDGDVAGGFILDGFPRTVVQAEALDRILLKLGRELECCLVMEVAEEALVKRLLNRSTLEGRSDDNADTILHRMKVYRQQTEPLVKYYRSRGILKELDGLGSMDEVGERIRRALGA